MTLYVVNFMTDSNLRTIQILSFIPIEPNYITTKEIMEKLERESPDFKVSLRTIQRDITALSINFSIIRYKKGWCYSKNTKVFQLPGMNYEAALGFKLIDKFLEKMLPPAIIEFLNPYLAKADEILNSDKNKELYKEWTEKIAVINTNPLIAPDIKPEIIHTVYEAIFRKKMIKVIEFQRRDLTTESFETSPLGLIFRDNNIYLVCTSEKYEYTVNRALHRIKKVEITDKDIEIPEGYSLSKASKAFDWLLSDKKFKFKAEVNKNISHLFYEKKISEDQKITPLKNENVIVEATIEDSYNFRFFLYTLADNIQILKPKELVDEFKDITKNLSLLYFSGENDM